MKKLLIILALLATSLAANSATSDWEAFYADLDGINYVDINNMKIEKEYVDFWQKKEYTVIQEGTYNKVLFRIRISCNDYNYKATKIIQLLDNKVVYNLAPSGKFNSIIPGSRMDAVAEVVCKQSD